MGIYDPLNKLSCSPTSDGAAACIVMSEEYVVKHGLQGQAIEIIGQSMRTDMPGAFDKDKPYTCINMVGASMAEAAANDVYAQTGKKASDVQVIERHDCFATNELITYEALGLAPKGQGHKIIMSKHPIGATGIAQCCELSWQLRNEAGKRQERCGGFPGGDVQALSHPKNQLTPSAYTTYLSGPFSATSRDIPGGSPKDVLIFWCSWRSEESDWTFYFCPVGESPHGLFKT